MVIHLPRHGTALPSTVVSDPRRVGELVGLKIAEAIRDQSSAAGPYVLAVDSGSTVRLVLRSLIDLAAKRFFSFDSVVLVTLVEYLGLRTGAGQSVFRSVLRELAGAAAPANLIALPFEGGDDLANRCANVDRQIRDLGGIDCAVFEPSSCGAIGFNGAPSTRGGPTRRVTLGAATRRCIAAEFFGFDATPEEGVALGMLQILAARKIFPVVTTQGKAALAKRMLEVERVARDEFPLSHLIGHPGVECWLDEAAAADLACVAYPWESDPSFRLNGESVLRRRAVIRVSETTGVPIADLTAGHFADAGIYFADPSHVIPARDSVIADLRCRLRDPEIRLSDGDSTLRSGDGTTETVLVTSPHPDDDVIAVGATTLAERARGSNVFTMTFVSGNIAVWDHLAEEKARDLDWVAALFSTDRASAEDLQQQILQALRHKKPGEPDTRDVLAVKAAIRREEMVDALGVLGVPAEHVKSLNLPFYETGGIEKSTPGTADFDLVVAHLNLIRPTRIYAAGDLTDPHGTHRVCFEILLEALRRIAETGAEWIGRTTLLLYNGAWAEWRIEEMDEIWPMTEPTLGRKLEAIRRHRSQVPKAVFAGSDPRSFDQRVEDRNRQTAALLRTLGITSISDGEIVAAEGFKRYPLSHLCKLSGDRPRFDVAEGASS